MRVLILSGGDLGDKEWALKNLPPYDFVVCADRGIVHLETLGLEPDLLVGDFDSTPEPVLKKYVQNGTPIITLPVEKDQTDTQYAVDWAMEKGATDVYILGALGNRWDHSFGNVMLLYRLEKNGIRGQILHSNNIIMMSNKLLTIKGDIGQIVSLLPFNGEVRIASTEGLKYPIHNRTLTQDFPIGISNVLTDSQATVKIESGWVIAVLARD